MARNYCPGYEGVPCYSDPYYAFYGYHSHNEGGTGAGGGNSTDPANNLPQNAPVTSFSGTGQGMVPVSGDSPIAQALGLTNDGIWWLVVIGITVLVVSGGSARSRR